MSRPLRLLGEGLTYHVTARGTGRMVIYRDEIDYRRFLAVVAAVVREQHLRCHAYCLMPNHYHLVVTTELANLSVALRQLNGIYAQRWNQRHQRVGHVFQGRFFAQLVQDGQYFLAACRYVVRNPVRAGLVAAPEDWPWSSFKGTGGIAAPARFLCTETLLQQFGDDEEAPWRYRAFVNEAVSAPDAIGTSIVFGDDAFAAAHGRRSPTPSAEVPGRERRTGQSLADFFSGASADEARRAAIVDAHRAGFSMRAIAGHLGVHYSTVSKVITAARLGEAAEADGTFKT